MINRHSVLSRKREIIAFWEFRAIANEYLYSVYEIYKTTLHTVLIFCKGYSCEEIVEVLDMMPWVCNVTKTLLFVINNTPYTLSNIKQYIRHLLFVSHNV